MAKKNDIPEDMRQAVRMPESEMEEILQAVPLLDRLIEVLKKLNK